MEVLIVGGSLSGLTFALACARRGIRTCVLERGHGAHQGGALGVDRDLLVRVTGNGACHGTEGHVLPMLAGKRRAATWRSVHDWLRGQAFRCPEITIRDGVTVTEITQSTHRASVTTMDGQLFEACLIVGADGYRSLVRRLVNPEQPDAKYAGYLLWRSLVDEASLSLDRFPLENDGVALVNEAGYRLIAYLVAGPDGSLAIGQRLISFAWYDAGRDDLLVRLHCIDDAGSVLRSLAAENIPSAVSEELGELARRIWPAPWRSAILHALEHSQVFATPVAEYSPCRLHRGRLAIIGDAAHVVSPVTGKGFVHGMRDAEVLAECLADVAGKTIENVSAALENYEHQRLTEARTLAAASAAWSQGFQWKRSAIF